MAGIPAAGKLTLLFLTNNPNVYFQEYWVTALVHLLSLIYKQDIMPHEMALGDPCSNKIPRDSYQNESETDTLENDELESISQSSTLVEEDSLSCPTPSWGSVSCCPSSTDLRGDSDLNGGHCRHELVMPGSFTELEEDLDNWMSKLYVRYGIYFTTFV